MTLAERFSLLRAQAEQHAVLLPAPLPACTLIFSASDGDARAEVLHCAAPSFAACWEQGLEQLSQRMERRKLAGRWLRVDWVTTAKAMLWRDFEALLATCRRSYFRYGFSLDEAFRIILTEQECNANAIFYGGAEIAHAVFNAKNFVRYAAKRFPGVGYAPFSPDRMVWQTATAGVFCDQDGQIHSLPGPVAGDVLHAGLNCGHRQFDQLTAGHVDGVVAAGSDWLARQILPDGRFIYGYFPCFARRINAYNSLRHTSSTYALIEAWEHIGNAEWEAPIRRALHFLTSQLIRVYTKPDGTRVAYLVDDTSGEIKLGGNGVALLTLTKWMDVTGSREYLDLLELLALGIGSMQNPDTGTFVHVLHSKDLSLKEPFRIIYYDGEAVFGLLRAYGITKDPRWLSMAEKAFAAFLIDDHWKAHDHWLSYSVNELTQYKPEKRYFRFGLKNADYLDFILTRETTFPTLLELMMAAQKMLNRLEGMPDMRHLLREVDNEKFFRALHYRAQYLLNGFFWPELAMYYQEPLSIEGAFFIRHHAFRARIDDAEHYLSGLIAYSKFLQKVKNAASHSAPDCAARNAEAQSKGAPASSSDLRRFPDEGADGVSLHSLHDHPARWTSTALLEATKGHWAVPPPEHWQAAGIAFTMAGFRPGMLLVRHSPGFSVLLTRRLAPDAAGIICEDPQGCPPGVPTLVVPNIQQAVHNAGRYARKHYQGKVIALTGSVGKTGTTYLLADVLSGFGAVEHSRSSSNMSLSTSRTMANMALDVPMWVIEMAHPRMSFNSSNVRPHIAIVLSIGETHLMWCGTRRTVAERKSKIFDGMQPGAVAILNRDMPEYDVVECAAKEKQLTCVRYGTHEDADIRLIECAGGFVTVAMDGVVHRFACSLPRATIGNVLAVLGCVRALGHPVEACFAGLRSVQPLPGRGRKHAAIVGGRHVTLIDDAYNANLDSMAAGLENLQEYTPAQASRLAILGDLAELGEEEVQKHVSLLEPIRKTGVDRLLLCGPLMEHLWNVVKTEVNGAWFSDVGALSAEVMSWIKDGDTILVKSSGHRLQKVVEQLLYGGFEDAAASHQGEGPVVAFGGGVNLARRQHAISTARGYAHALGGINPLKSADLSLVNMECVVATTGRRNVKRAARGSDYYRARPEQLRILLEAGISMVATANGHSGDYGPEALLEQAAWLDKAGIYHAGSGPSVRDASAPVYVPVRDRVVAIFSVDATNRYFAANEDQAGVWYMPLHNADLWYKEFVPRIEQARSKAHNVLVAVRWGAGDLPVPAKSQIAVGHALIAAGADAVLGSSAYSVKGVEVYRGRPIIYDAGNLLSDVPSDGFADTGVFTLKLSEHGVTEVGFWPILSGYGFSVPATGAQAKQSLAVFEQKSADLHTRTELLPDRGRIRLTPPPRGGRPALDCKVTPRPRDIAPEALNSPPPDCVVEIIPDRARIEPVRLGPLTLLGCWVDPRCKTMRERRMVGVETYWSVEAPADECVLDIQLVPVREGMEAFGAGMWHEPCDWMWPTSRWKPGIIYRDVAGLRPPAADKIGTTELVLTCKVLAGNKVMGVYTSPERFALSLSV